MTLPLACVFLLSGRGTPRRSSDIMASFDEYLREGRLFEDYDKATLLEKQEVYNNWLRLKNLPTIAPGNVRPRLLSASMLNFESPTLHCLILA